MIKSMTGFGHAAHENERFSVACEIKSLNSKSMDILLKLPKALADKEFEIRELVQKHLDRGKVSVQIDLVYRTEARKRLTVNKELAKAYYKELYETAALLGAPETDVFRMAMQMPDVLSAEVVDTDNKEEWETTLPALEHALKACNTFREREGEALMVAFRAQLQVIQEALNKVEQLEGKRILRLRERLHQNLAKSELSNDQIDYNRLEQEIIYYIEKIDITEEKVRLTQHLRFFDETLQLAVSNGKKLNFIAQEIGREINTIGSKANDADIQMLVVSMKEELEKIKEQILNIV
jgi:uncharacterized protein (TIGR00255 family)